MVGTSNISFKRIAMKNKVFLGNKLPLGGGGGGGPAGMLQLNNNA